VLELARKYQAAVETVEWAPRAPARQPLPHREPCCVPSPWRRLVFAASCARPPAGAQPSRYLKDQRGLSESTLEASRSATPPIAGTACSPSSPRWKASRPSCSKPPAWWSTPRAAKRPTTGFRQSGDGGRSHDPPGPGDPASGAQPSMAVNPKSSSFPETEVFEKGKHLFGLASRPPPPSARTTRRWWWRANFDVDSPPRRRPHQCVAPRSATALRQPADQLQLCRAAKAAGSSAQFSTRWAAVRCAPAGDRLRWEQPALQGQLGIAGLHLPPPAEDPDRHSSRNTAPVNTRPGWMQAPLAGLAESSRRWRQGLARSGPVPARPFSALVALAGKLPQSAVRSH